MEVKNIFDDQVVKMIKIIILAKMTKMVILGAGQPYAGMIWCFWVIWQMGILTKMIKMAILTF